MGSADQPPRPPLNLVGDFGGGSTFVVIGILAALWERERSGKGRIIDAAIVDGVSSLMSFFAGLLPQGVISLNPQENILGGEAPFYRCYRCSDGLDVAIGAIEPQFYKSLLERISAPLSLLDGRDEPANWSAQSQILASIFASRTREEWCNLLEGTDACFAPVLTIEEAAQHPHMVARRSYTVVEGTLHAAPAPRFLELLSDMP